MAHWRTYAHACMAAMILSSCGSEFTPNITPTKQIEARLNLTEWRIVPENSAWLNLPSMDLVLMRNFASVSEQKILLPNDTSLTGDNFIHIHSADKIASGRISLARVIENADGFPSPFKASDMSQLRTRTDETGPLHWVE